MLFKSLYNWVKYKTLPPSLLFRNRLFIERDSRNKRILNNLGWIFRSSKWGTRQLPNIMLSSKSIYLNGILYFTLILLFIYISIYLYSNSYILLIFKLFLFNIWIITDIMSYLFFFITWFLIASISFIIKIGYSFVWYTTRTVPTSAERAATYPYLQLNARYLDEKYLLYFWLNNNIDIINVPVLENIFTTTLNTNESKSTLDLFRNLYLAVYYINVSSTNLYTNWDNLPKLATQSNYSLLFNLIVDKSSKYGNFNLVTRKSNWNLSTLTDKYSLTGLFTLSDSSISAFNKLTLTVRELRLFEQTIQANVQSIKWFRWLYRYSTLHRSSFSYGRFITMPLNEISGNYLNSLNLENNTWFAKYSTVPTFNLFTREWSNMFLNGKANLLTNSNNQGEALANLNRLTSSYNWYLKRWYYLNTLKNQSINLNTIFNNVVTSNLTNSGAVSPKQGFFSERSLFLNQHNSLRYYTTSLSKSVNLLDSINKDYFNLGNLYTLTYLTSLTNNLSFTFSATTSRLLSFQPTTSKLTNSELLFSLNSVVSSSAFNSDFYYFTKL